MAMLNNQMEYAKYRQHIAVWPYKHFQSWDWKWQPKTPAPSASAEKEVDSNLRDERCPSRVPKRERENESWWKLALNILEPRCILLIILIFSNWIGIAAKLYTAHKRTNFFFIWIHLAVTHLASCPEAPWKCLWFKAVTFSMTFSSWLHLHFRRCSGLVFFGHPPSPDTAVIWLFHSDSAEAIRTAGFIAVEHGGVIQPWYLGDGGDLGEPLSIFNLDSGHLLAIEHGDYPVDLPIEHGGSFHSFLLTFTRPGMST